MKNNDDMDMLLVLRCLLGLVENNQGKIDQYFGTLIQLTTELMKMGERTAMLKKFLCQIFSVYLWYSPQKTFDHLNQSNILGNVFSLWIEKIPEFSNDYEKERILYGLSSLLALKKNEMPNCVNIPQIMKLAAKISNEIVKLRTQDDTATDNQGSTSMKKGLHYGTDVKDAYQMFKQQTNNINLNKEDILNMSDDSDDSDWDENEMFEEMEGFQYDSPLESSCSVIFLKDVLAQKQNSDPQYCQELANC